MLDMAGEVDLRIGAKHRDEIVVHGRIVRSEKSFVKTNQFGCSTLVIPACAGMTDSPIANLLLRTPRIIAKSDLHDRLRL